MEYVELISGFMNLFGVKKKAALSGGGPSSSVGGTGSASETIQLLRTNVEMLDKREHHISLKIEAALREAKEKAAKKDKKGAIVCLKRKKMYEAEIDKLQGARVTLEQQVCLLCCAHADCTSGLSCLGDDAGGRVAEHRGLQGGRVRRLCE